MGQPNEGERDPNAKSNRFQCGSNKQTNKHAKTKSRKSKSIKRFVGIGLI